MKLKQILFSGIVLILIAIIGFSGYQLWDIHRNNAQESTMHDRLLTYRPTPQTSPQTTWQTSPLFDVDDNPGSCAAPVANQSIIDLREKYPDVIGWLYIANTRIDYPFAQAHDNEYYLHRDLDRNRSTAGTIFMDYRNSNDFSDFNTIIYGHNMRNGSMFGTLENFNDLNFFNTNVTGTIFLANETFEIEFMAFAVIKPNDAVIYNPNITTEADKIIFFDHIRNTARYYRDINITTNDRVITLSTCNYEFNNARMVLIGRILNNFKIF